MKLIDEFRDPARAKSLVQAIRTEAESLDNGPYRVMEVCGTHTMAIARHGLRQVLPENIELISGPGCPVCVTSTAEVDLTVDLAGREGVTVATFGDMFRVPGTELSLARAKAQGAAVEMVYSASDAVGMAAGDPDRKVVFLGIGFETTAPTVAAAVLQAQAQGLTNFSVLSCHKTLPPALEALLKGGRAKIHGFLMPGHVTIMIGAKAYLPVAENYGLNCVVAGFEPVDILASILMLIRDLAAEKSRVRIQYNRGPTWEGNRPAMAVLNRVFEPGDSLWRGLGPIPGSGLAFREEFSAFDAVRELGLSPAEALEVKDPPGCRCGEVLQGLLRPPECGLFDKVCTPSSPVGPCMVSSEGSCAAYHRYR